MRKAWAEVACSAFQVSIEVFVRADEQEPTGLWIVLVSQQKASADALELVDKHAGEVSLLRLAHRRIFDDRAHGRVDIRFLI